MANHRSKLFAEEGDSDNKERLFLCHDEKHKRAPDVDRVYTLHQYCHELLLGDTSRNQTNWSWSSS
jgi:hypothetical protein